MCVRCLRGVDIRYEAERRWYSGLTSACRGCYDLWAVTAHEAGHAIGLAHHASRNMTMYDQCFLGRVARTLGAADVLGLRHLYPVGLTAWRA